MKNPDFTPAEIAELVTGAQRFLAPVPDDEDDEAVYTHPDESIQEWARWNSLTSGEEGWTGQNEPIS